VHCVITTKNRTPTFTFDEILSLLKWNLELMNVVHCSNRSWINDIIAYVLQNDQLLGQEGKCPDNTSGMSLGIIIHLTWENRSKCPGCWPKGYHVESARNLA